MSSGRSALAVVVLVIGASAAHAGRPATPPPAPPQAAPEVTLDEKLAVWRFDALGIDPQIVQRLETLFRMELGRLDRRPLPSPLRISKEITSRRERECTGEPRCLAAIGKRLGVDVIITGTVGALGDNYVLTIKAVDVATRKSRQIQSRPLRGSPDDLIEGVRVAAYQLLAPQQLHGAVQIQSDLVGATVTLDGKVLGKTPLRDQGVIGKLSLGKHELRVKAPHYDPIDRTVVVHFQKVSPVLVHLLPSHQVLGTGRTITVKRHPFYTRTWFIVAVGVAAVGVGALIGHRLGRIPTMQFPQGGP